MFTLVHLDCRAAIVHQASVKHLMSIWCAVGASAAGKDASGHSQLSQYYIPDFVVPSRAFDRHTRSCQGAGKTLYAHSFG